MGLVTLLAVSLLRAGTSEADQGQGGAASPRPETQQVTAGGLVVDTSAVSPQLRISHGSIDPDKVRDVVSAQRDEIRSCYERAVQENPGLAGTCTVRIVITGDGTVGTTSFQKSSIHSVTLGRCLLQLVRTWRFPPPSDGKTAAVDYPLGFRRVASDAGS
jgi:TonB family protein